MYSKAQSSLRRANWFIRCDDCAIARVCGTRPTIRQRTPAVYYKDRNCIIGRMWHHSYFSVTQGDNRGSLSRYTVRSLEASGKVVPFVGRPVQFSQNFPTKTSKIPRVNRSSSLPLMCEAVSLVTVHTSILLERRFATLAQRRFANRLCW